MMIADLLLRPDNRLLGGATGDFSLFGGQPVPGVTFGRDGSGHVSISPPSPSGGWSAGPDAAPPARSAVADDVPAIEPDSSDTASVEYAGPSPITGLVAAPAFSPADAAAPDAPLVPTALSSGAVVLGGSVGLGLADAVGAPPPAPSNPVSGALAGVTTGLVAPVIDQIAAPLGGVTGTVTALTDTLVPTIVDTVDAVADTIAPVTQPLDDTLQVAGDVIDATVSPLAEPVAQITAPALDTAAATVATVVAATADVVAPVAGTAAAVVAPVVDTAADLVTPVAYVLAPATQSIADAVQPAGATLQAPIEAVATIADEAFGGSDPVAGVQTLVGMVGDADAFDVIAPGTESTADAPSMLDDLADDVADAVPILGTDPDASSDEHGLFGDHDGMTI